MVKCSKKNNKLKGGNPYIGKLCREKNTLQGHSRCVTSVAFHPTEPILVTGSYDKTAKLWRFTSDGAGQILVSTLEGHNSGTVFSVAFRPNGDLLATGNEDNTARVWQLSQDADAATPVSTLGGHGNSVWSVAFDPTGKLFATGSEDKTVQVWRMSPDGAAATPVATLAGHSNWVVSVAFHPTGRFVATGSWDKTARVWRVSPDNDTIWTCVSTLAGHSDCVRSVAFDPTGRFVVTGSFDKTARVWRMSPDGAAATCVATLAGHSSIVYSVAFHPIGQFLVTGSGDNTVKLWRIPTDRLNLDRLNLECIETLTGHTAPVTSVAFDPSGNLLATGSRDTTAKLWNCSKISVLLRMEALTRGSLSARVIKDFTTGTSDQGLRFSNAAQGRLGNPPDTLENRRKQAKITSEKYKGLLPREPISSTPSDDFIQCDRCRANDIDMAIWSSFIPRLRALFENRSKSRCTECPGEATEVDTDKMPGGRRSRRKVKKRLSIKLLIR